MATITHADADTTHRVLITGLSGSGKSTLAAELSTKYKLIWFDLENSKDVLMKLTPEQLARVNYIRIPDSAVYPIASQTLMQLFKYGVANICDKHGKHECAICKKENAPTTKINFEELTPDTFIVIDSLTQLSASILAYVTKDKPVDYKPQLDDWGSLRKFSEFFASQLQACPHNLVCTSLAVETELEDGRIKLVPSFGSKDMSSKIAKAFSDVIYIEVKNKKHVAVSSSVASNTVLAKSRSDFVIESLEELSLIPLFDSTQERHKQKTVSPVPKQATPQQAAVNNLNTLLTSLKSKGK